MPTLFYDIPKTFRALGTKNNLIWYALALSLTAICVLTGFDWYYFLWAQKTGISHKLFSAVLIGGLVPIIFPLLLLLYGHLRHIRTLRITAWALGQSALLGLVVSSLLKAFTGRIPPMMWNTTVDISRTFQFGFLEGGVFWGWPSSHTTIAWAMAMTLITLYPRSKILKILALTYALYIGIGISTSIHWFSEFVAGAILGSLIGISIAKSFKTLLH